MLTWVFVDGSYNGEVEFDLYSPYGELIASGYGEGNSDLVVNGTTYTNGDTVFGFDVLGSDCDDTDAAIYMVVLTLMVMDTVHA